MSDPSHKRKVELRIVMKLALSEMTDEARRAASQRACARVAGLEEFRDAAVVMLYMPLVSEVDLTSLALRCFQTGKTVCVPRVDFSRRELVPVEVTSFDDHVMDLDEHGVRTPRHGRPVSPALIDLSVVPGLAFDAQGHRLGRGGGYYDRFLTRLRPDAVKVALAFDSQIVDEVPVNFHDSRVDVVVTDRRVIEIGRKRARTRRR